MNKITGLVIVLVTLLTFNVSCQNLDGRENSGNQRISQMNQKMKTELDLDQKQELDWDEINKKYANRFKDLRADESLDRNVKREKAKNMFAELDKELLAILNEDQKKEFTELVKQNRAIAKDKYQKRQGEHSGQRKEQNKGQGIKNELKLTEDQSEKWDKINADYRSKMQGIKSGGDLSNDEKRNDIENLLGEKDSEIMAILDSEQQASYLQLVDERRAQAKDRKNKNQ